MPVANLKILGNDGTYGIVNAANPLPVAAVDGGGAAGPVDVTDRAARQLGVINDIDDDATRILGLLAATENIIGRMGSLGVTIAVTPTVTAGAYSANDCVGGVLTFANAARVAGYGGVIKSLVVVDDARQQDSMELWLFDRTFTSPGDNAAWNCLEADAENLIGVINLADGQWFDGGAGSDVCDVEASKRYVCNATSLFGQLVTRGTPTYAATDDLTIKIGLLED